jgi:hypothetical protein
MEFKEFENDYEEYGFKEVDITGHEQDKIAVERLLRHEYAIGESVSDDIDQYISIHWNNTFVGYVLAKRPDLNEDILEIINECKNISIDLSEICELFDDGSDEDPHKEFLRYYAEYLNLTPRTRKRVNKHLINISIGYGEEANV